MFVSLIPQTMVQISFSDITVGSPFITVNKLCIKTDASHFLDVEGETIETVNAQYACYKASVQIMASYATE